MDEDILYEERKNAIHLLRSGVSKTEVASKLNRSRAWVHKWWNRYDDNKDFADLHRRSRAPKSKLTKEMRREIKRTRSELEAENNELRQGVQILTAQLVDRGIFPMWLPDGVTVKDVKNQSKKDYL